MSNVVAESGRTLQVMSQVAASLSEPGDLGETLQRITRTARETVPGAEHASISVRHSDGRLLTMAPTDPLTTEADGAQYELREGPCYDAVTDADVSYSPDLGADDRWPRYGPRARRLGFRSQLAIRLGSRDGSYTGLNLYASVPRAFDDDPSGVARLFASHAKVALGFARELDTLKGAVGTRQVIGEAIGIVIERYGLTEERAFEFLIRLSQTSNVRLRDVAVEIVKTATGALSDAS